MASETCPRCGAARRYMQRYDCGTWHCAPDFPSTKCLRNQLAAVTAERDDLQQRIDAAPVMWAVLAGDKPVPLKVCESLIEANEEADEWDAAYDRTSVTRVRLVAEPEPEEERLKNAPTSGG